MNCEDCGEEIPAIRLELLDTRWCVRCSDKHVFQHTAHTVYIDKTTPVFVIARTPECARRLSNISKRKR